MPSVLGAAEGFLRVEPFGGLWFLSNNIQTEERRDRHFVRAARFYVALEVLGEARSSRHRNLVSHDIHELNNAAILQHLAHTAS